MFRPTSTLAPIVLALVAASCRSGPSEQRLEAWDKGALMHTPSTTGSRHTPQQTLRDYKVVMSAHQGKVGFIKVYDVTEGGGNPYPWSYVYDLDWKELGFVDQFGGAFRYHFYSPAEAAQQNLVLRGERLPADSLQNNVMRMLGIDVSMDELSFPTATKSDITGDTGAMHLAGPGVTPAKGPVEPPAK